MIREIIRMKNNGFSNIRISESLGKSRTTVIKYLNAFGDSGFSLEELLELSDNDLLELFEAQDLLSPAIRKAHILNFMPFSPMWKRS